MRLDFFISVIKYVSIFIGISIVFLTFMPIDFRVIFRSFEAENYIDISDYARNAIESGGIFKSSDLFGEEYDYICLVHNSRFAASRSRQLLLSRGEIGNFIDRLPSGRFALLNDVYLDDLNSAIVLVGNKTKVIISKNKRNFYVDQERCSTLGAGLIKIKSTSLSTEIELVSSNTGDKKL